MTECSGANSCPAVIAMDDGDFYVIGLRAPLATAPEGATVGPDEAPVIVPRDVMRAFVAEYMERLP
jgi:hypothetical protein